MIHYKIEISLCGKFLKPLGKVSDNMDSVLFL